jgi:uncharacterized small protein (DUF1192 family)
MEFASLELQLREERAEIARLQATIDGVIKKGMSDLTTVAAFQVNEELRAEIERLKAALQLSQSQNYCTLCGALEDKP